VILSPFERTTTSVFSAKRGERPSRNISALMLRMRKIGVDEIVEVDMD
jgi:hypothetical protein